MTHFSQPLPALELDHLVVAAATLAQGMTWLEQRLGVPVQPGGQHVSMGTHNALLKLGAGRYLEVIAVDPNSPQPQRPRWFSLDDSATRAAISQRPQLLHWVARTSDFDRCCELFRRYFGPTLVMCRNNYCWRITVPTDGSLPGRGMLPSLIQWDSLDHPADLLPDRSCRLKALHLAGPDLQLCTELLSPDSYGQSISLAAAATVSLTARLDTPTGEVVLD